MQQCKRLNRRRRRCCEKRHSPSSPQAARLGGQECQAPGKNPPVGKKMSALPRGTR